MLFFVLFFQEILVKEVIFTLRSNYFEEVLGESRNIFNLLLLQCMFEYDDIAVEIVFTNFYKELLEKRQYNSLINQTKNLVLHIFSIKFPINSSKTIRDSYFYTKDAIKRSKSDKICNSA